MTDKSRGLLPPAEIAQTEPEEVSIGWAETIGVGAFLVFVFALAVLS